MKVTIMLWLLIFVSICGAQALECEYDQVQVPSYLLASNVSHAQTNVHTLSYNESYSMGVSDASSMHSSSGWFLGGVGSGLVLGLIGTGIITLAAGGAQPGYLPDDVDTRGYISGYQKKSKSKNQTSAAIGGFVGTAVIVGLVIAASN